jgi:hypothetical protein
MLEADAPRPPESHTRRGSKVETNAFADTPSVFTASEPARSWEKSEVGNSKDIARMALVAYSMSGRCCDCEAVGASNWWMHQRRVG